MKKKTCKHLLLTGFLKLTVFDLLLNLLHEINTNDISETKQLLKKMINVRFISVWKTVQSVGQ